MTLQLLRLLPNSINKPNGTMYLDFYINSGFSLRPFFVCEPRSKLRDLFRSQVINYFVNRKTTRKKRRGKFYFIVLVYENKDYVLHVPITKIFCHVLRLLLFNNDPVFQYIRNIFYL